MHWTPSCLWYKGWQLSFLKGVRRIPTLQPRLQTRHRVPCKQDFRFKLLWRKERRSGICKTGFPNLQIGASVKACPPLTWSSSNRLHFAGTICLASQVSKTPKQRSTKTLPKAQRTRGLSSYLKFKHKSWSISSSESRPSINFNISTKLSLSVKLVQTKLQNLDQDSTS